MLGSDTPANVISLEAYRRARLWPDPPRPGPIGGRKSTDDALLVEVVIADAARTMRPLAVA
jgi:hypothetical protein